MDNVLDSIIEECSRNGIRLGKPHFSILIQCRIFFAHLHKFQIFGEIECVNKYVQMYQSNNCVQTFGGLHALAPRLDIKC